MIVNCDSKYDKKQDNSRKKYNKEYGATQINIIIYTPAAWDYNF